MLLRDRRGFRKPKMLVSLPWAGDNCYNVLTISIDRSSRKCGSARSGPMFIRTQGFGLKMDISKWIPHFTSKVLDIHDHFCWNLGASSENERYRSYIARTTLKIAQTFKPHYSLFVKGSQLLMSSSCLCLLSILGGMLNAEISSQPK